MLMYDIKSHTMGGAVKQDIWCNFFSGKEKMQVIKTNQELKMQHATSLSSDNFIIYQIIG